MGYTLMISEKPDAAKKIAYSLGENVEEFKVKRTRFYKFKKGSEEFYVIPAVGHLFGLKHSNGKKWTYPVFDNEWVPVFEANNKSNYTKQYYNNFKKYGKKAGKFIVCTDWDNEGSVIAYNILRFILKRKNADRMFFTTLTKEELNESFSNRKKSVDFGMINAGLARHKLDWMYGINLTRALTIALKKARGGFYLLSTGRVQGPTLKILVEKEEIIQKFVPKDYWSINLKWNKEYEAYYKKSKIFDKKLMDEVVCDCGKENKGIIKEVKVKKVKVNPPVPFNLTSLQNEAYKQFKYNPYKTQQLAQKLYINALISYPRTSSEKLPKKIKYEKIIKDLSKQSFYKKCCKKLLSKSGLKPVEGKKDDKAHTAIYPTGEKPGNLSVQEKNLYDLIVRRFFSVFGESGLKENKKVLIDVNGHDFKSRGSTILEKGWMEYYGKYAYTKELILPEIKEGDAVKISDFKSEKKQTLPPNRYSQAGIVNEMEKRGIGTKATRAGIVKTLIDRGYVHGESLKVTKLGTGVINALKEHCPRIISEDLTKKFEKQMDLISNEKESKEEVIVKAQDILIDISNEFKDNEKKIGEKLSKALEATWEEESNVGDKVGKCKNCGSELVIMYSKKNGREFVGCSNYPKCSTAYNLPLADYELTSEVCPTCNTPIILVGKNKYRTCLDRNCPERSAGTCPECGNNLRIMYSRRGSRFIGCSNFPKCKKLYGLPRKGDLKLRTEKCEKCDSPTIYLNDEVICLNKECGGKNG